MAERGRYWQQDAFFRFEGKKPRPDQIGTSVVREPIKFPVVSKKTKCPEEIFSSRP